MGGVGEREDVVANDVVFLEGVELSLRVGGLESWCVGRVRWAVQWNKNDATKAWIEEAGRMNHLRKKNVFFNHGVP